MKSFLLPVFIFIGLLPNAINLKAQSTYYQVSVYFKTGVTRIVSPGDTAASVTAQDILNVLAKYSLPTSNVYPAFPSFVETDTLKVIDKLGDSLKQMDKAKVFVITVPDTTTQNNLIADLKNLTEVLFAEENGYSIPYTHPDDPGYGNQWGLNNASNPGHDIHAEAAWSIFTGNPSSIIGIIDYGVDVTHPDLSAKIAGGDKTYTLDNGLYSHGTLVAGIAAASTNNNIGMSGVDWQAQLLPQDISDYNNCFCIPYFKNEHGDVVINQKIYNSVNFSPNLWTLNHSYGLTFKNMKDGRYSLVVRDGFAYAYKNNRTSVAAVGNAEFGTTPFPAGFNTGLIGVGASDQNDFVNSTTGPFVDVLAPGIHIYSTDHNNQYIYENGTSLSSPFVSGLASLLKGYNTSLLNDDIEQIMDLSADYYGTTPPYDEAYGYGRINAQRALQYLESPYQVQHLTVTGSTIYATSGNLKMVMLGVLGLSDGLYTVQRVEVRTTITLPTTDCKIVGVWGTGMGTNGFRDDGGYCFGEGFCQVVPGSVTSTNATLRTYIYYATNTLGQVIGYFPRTPQNVKFSYTILGIPSPEISGDNMVCTTSNPYTLTNLPSNATVAWSATPTTGAQINTPNANTTTLTKLISGVILLNALVTNGCGVGQNVNAVKSVQIGGPYVGINYGTDGPCNGSMQPWSLAASPASGTNWSWSVGHLNNNSSIYLSTPNASSTIADVTGGGAVNLNYNDLCGVPQLNGVTVYSSCHSQAIIAPNPANSTISISTTSTVTGKVQTDGTSTISTPWKIYQMKLSGPTGNLVGAYNYPDGVTSTSINVSNLPNGTYTVQLFDKLTWTTQQVVILR